MKTHRYSPRKSLVVCTSLLILFTLLLAACGSPSTTGKSGSQTVGATPTSAYIPTNLYIVAQSLNPTSADHGFLYAMSARNGTQRWQYTTEKGGIFSVGEIDGQVYITTAKEETGGTYDYTSSLVVLKASDGTVLWQYTTPVNDMQYSKDLYGPFVEKGVVYLGANLKQGQNRILAFRSTDGKILWQYQVPGKERTNLNDLQMAGGVLYYTTADLSNVGESASKGVSTIYALRLSNQTILWQYILRDEGDTAAHLVMNPERGEIYVSTGMDAPNSGSDATTLYVLRMSDGELLWRHTYPGWFDSWWEDSGILFIRAESPNATYYRVYAVRVENGSVLWTYTVSLRIIADVKVANGVIYVSSQNWPEDKTHGVQIDAKRASDGTTLWQRKFDNQELASSFKMTQEAMYFTTYTLDKDSSSVSGILVNALRLKDGTTLWNKPWNEDIQYILVQNDVMYAGSRVYSGPDQGIEGTSGGSLCAYRASDASKLWCQDTKIGVSWFIIT